MRLTSFTLFLWMGVLCLSPLYAQSQPSEESVHISLWGGYSFTSVRLLGKTRSAQSTITGIGLRREIRVYDNGNRLFYTADIIPYIHFDYPKRDDGDRKATRTGWGLSPVGFLLKKSDSKLFTPFIQASGSMIQMEQEFPTDLSKKFNFTFGISLGTDIKLTEDFFISLGYKFHHISNAQTGEENPGLDSNFLFFSLSTY